MRSTLTPVAIILTMAAQTANLPAASDPLLFRVSFDQSCAPEKAVGGSDLPFVSRDAKRNPAIAIVPGKLGNCASVAPGQQLVYEAEGNAYVAAGTLAFFWRPDADPSGKNILILDLSPLERVNYSRFLKVSYSHETVCAVPFAGPRQMASADARRGTFRQGQWHHVAVAWDQARGLGIYVDGKPAAVAKGEWHYEGNFNHFGLGLETRPDYRPDGAQFAQSYDEFRVYDRWLDDDAIVALAEGKEPRIGQLDATAYVAHKRRLYGWDGAGPLKPALAMAPGSAGLGLVQAGIAKARDVKRSCWLAFDGERARRWPGSSGYYDRGRALDFQLCPGQRFDVAQILARGEVKLMLSGSDKPLVVLSDKAISTAHAVLDAPTTSDAFRLTRPLANGGVVYEVNLFQTVPFDADALKGARGWQASSLARLTEAKAQPAEMSWIRRTFYTPDQEALVAADGPAEGVQNFAAMRTVHILGPACPVRRGVGAVALDLAVTCAAEPNALRIDVLDPLNPERYAATADVGVIGAAGRLRVLLDLRDLVLPPGARPRLALTFRGDTRVDLASSAVAWRWLSVAEALRQFAPDQLARARDIFQEISESRPWGYDPGALKTLRFLLNGIDTLHALLPDDEVVSSYWHWVHPREPKAIRKFPEPPPGLPAWAVYLDGAIMECKKVPYWWIANRENRVGEFGANDGINDDTDLVMDWWALDLMRGPDAVLRESLRRVAENSWHNCMRGSGLGHYTDALHTYEDGMNAQCHMALMAYGNPVYLERLFKTARYYKDLLAVAPKCGHLHFRGSWYGYDGKGGVHLDPAHHGWDDGDNALALQPGMLIAWYNGNPMCRRTVVDWTDGMMAHDMVNLAKDHRLVGAAINPTTGEQRLSDRHVSFGYGFFSAPWAAYEFTGGKKYLDFIRLGMERDLRDYQRIRQTGHVGDRYVQETGDRALADRHLAAIKAPHLWQRSIHNDDYLDLESFYFAWQCTGELNTLTEGIKLTYNDITWELPMLTTGEQSTDRVWLPQRLINKVALGGAAMLRNELYPKHALSWENATGRIAPMVKVQDTKHFQAWVVNLEEKPVSVAMRVWRLDHGQYELTEGIDANQDGAFDGPTRRRMLELARFERIPLTLPARSVAFITCQQVQALDDIRQRPDLAVCAEDAEYDARSGSLTVRVHNIGSKPTGPYTVRITVADKVLLEQESPSLDAPVDCLPQVADFQVRVADARQPVTVEADPGKAIAEIAEVNNAVKFIPANLSPPWPITCQR